MATILVVDDEFGVAELLEAVLSEAGYRVLTAINGQHGLEVLAGERVDLVFLDFMMPVMNGAMMLRAMTADPALDGIPVVIMSSLPEAAVAERSSGYADFLRKPFRISAVLGIAGRLVPASTGPAG
jgi:CheY-like chemotaxis protein